MIEPGGRWERTASAEPVGVGVALAAILVQAPRLVLAVLAADRLPVDADAERALLVIAGVGTALVLTGGNLYLAHAIARVRRWRRALAAVWLAVLVSSGGLVVPLVAAGLRGRTLPQLLGSELLAWSWSLLAALAHEVTAAGCVLAAAAAAAGERLAAARTAAEGSRERELDELLRQRDAARGELAALRLAGAGSGASRVAGSDAPAPAGLRSPADGSSSRVAGSGWPSAGSGAGERAATLACPEGCGRSFASAQARSGHLRHCAARRERLRRLAAAGS
jgi:MFS family permease